MYISTMKLKQFETTINEAKKIIYVHTNFYKTFQKSHS